MRDAAARNPGAMLAIHKSVADVRAILAATGAEAVVANDNGPEDVVVSGGVDAILTLERAFEGAQVRRLPVSAAFHSPAVAPAVPDLRSFLDRIELRPTRIEVLGNADAAPYPLEPARMRARLAAQLALPVQFARVIEAMYERGVRIYVEVGPGAVLTDLIGRILGDRPHLAVETDRKKRNGMTGLQLALGRLAVAGVPVDFAPLWAEPPHQDVGSRKASGASVRITGANHGKPYPENLDVERSKSEVRSLKATTSDVILPGPRAPSIAPAATPASPAAPAASGTLIEVFQEAQRQAAETHAAFQRALSDSHVAFLKAAEASMQTLAALATGTRAPLPRLPMVDSSAFPAAPSAPPLPAESDPSPAAEEAAVEPSVPHPKVDLGVLLLAIIAEKTGYQESLLSMDMDLESDLGIDSIKRVEILAALRDRLPSLPEVTPVQIAQLRTLGEVARYLRDQVESMTGATPVPAQERSGDAAGGPQRGLPDAPSDAPPRYAVRAVVEPAIGMTLSRLTAGGRLVVTDEGGGVAHALVAELARRGVDAEVVAGVPPDADCVIFLGGLRTVGSVDAAIEVNKEAFRAARLVAPRFSSGAHLFVTVQDTGGDFGLSGAQPLGAWLGGVAALVRTARHEWPDASLKAG